MGAWLSHDRIKDVRAQCPNLVGDTVDCLHKQLFGTAITDIYIEGISYCVEFGTRHLEFII